MYTYLSIYILFMKNLRHLLLNPVEGIQYRMDKSFTWHAEHVLYLLNMHAQTQIEKKLWIKPDLCLLTNCDVRPGQQAILTTPATESKLLWFDVDALLIQELFWTEWRKPNLSQYLTTSWKMANGLYCGLLISEEDIRNALQSLLNDK